MIVTSNAVSSFFFTVIHLLNNAESHELLVVHSSLSIPVLLPLVILSGEARRSIPFLQVVATFRALQL